MVSMPGAYERDLDLNLLRVLVVVADTGSVTEAAKRLYVTQPAVSAALRRLRDAIGEPVFVRAGRSLVLSARGRALVERARPHLEGLVAAAQATAPFDPRTAERTVRLGLADSAESWLLPPLVHRLAREAPLLRVVAVAVQFRNVAALLANATVDVAITVADDLPSGVHRHPLYRGRFVCLFDPRHVSLGKKPSRARYLAAEHVVVSYNGDLRGIVEDFYGVERRVRVSVPTFHAAVGLVDGGALVATVPDVVAADARRHRPHLRVASVPFALEGAAVELLQRAAVRDDPAIRFVVSHVERIARERGD
jgi:LysR family transcriptional activator of mexEF-oprN operon